MTRRASICWLVTLGAATAAALPAQSVSDQLRGLFKRYDQNGNGTMARAEFPGSDRQFESMDADGNGTVTFEEYARSDVARRFARARYKNDREPRERTTTEELQLRRLEWIKRFDQDRNGKVTAAEWTGSNLAFLSLDANGDGVIDRKDVAEARGNARPPAATLPEMQEIPEPEALLAMLDRDRDGALSPREVARHPLSKVFREVDRNDNSLLEQGELAETLEALRRRARAREETRRRQVAFRVPFSSWDKNKDGKLEVNEFESRQDLFLRIDANRDAAVTEDEVERYRRSVEGDDFISRFDLNDDGRVTLAEFGGPPSAFRRADSNGDGVVTRRDR